MSRKPWTQRNGGRFGVRPIVALIIGIGFLFLPALGSILTASIAMAPSLLTIASSEVTADSQKPIECNGFTVTDRITGSGAINGAGANELILGGAGDDTITGGAGEDCIVGGAGSDAIDGGLDPDVCIGNALTVFTNCETQIRR